MPVYKSRELETELGKLPGFRNLVEWYLNYLIQKLGNSSSATME